MAGVASPMLRRTRTGGARFLTGLAVGGIAAGLLLSIPVYLAGRLLEAVVPATGRTAGLVAVCLVLGIADVRNRTPHPWRQVPQALVRRFPPGTLGLTWGFDLGLLVTTQKTTSLIWVAIAAAVLTGPSAAAALLVGAAVVAAGAVAARSLQQHPFTFLEKREQRWFTQVRRMSGISILILALVSAVPMLPT